MVKLLFNPNDGHGRKSGAFTVKGKPGQVNEAFTPKYAICYVPRCDNLASRCCGGLCWTCHAAMLASTTVVTSTKAVA